MGNLNSANDEWIELYNNEEFPLNIDGWILKTKDDGIIIPLKGTIPAKSYLLLERSDDNTVLEEKADIIYTGSLNNNGETLEIYNNENNLVESLDCSSGWFAGDNSLKKTMSKDDKGQWKNSLSENGTPRKINNFIIEEDIEDLNKKEEIFTFSKEKDINSNGWNKAIPISLISGILILILKKNLK